MIDPTAKVGACHIGKGVSIGYHSIIEDGVQIQDGVKIGDYCIIRKGTHIGFQTKIESFVELRANTHIGTRCKIDSGVRTSGNCVIGNRVTLRYEVIIARGCEIGHGSYLAPRVMTNNLNAGREQIGGAKVGQNCFIGTHTVLQHGIEIGDNTTVGSMSFVNKDISGGLWIGIPARLLRAQR